MDKLVLISANAVTPSAIHICKKKERKMLLLLLKHMYEMQFTILCSNNTTTNKFQFSIKKVMEF